MILVLASPDSAVTGLLDDRPFSAFQLSAVSLAAATVILDGLDNQMLGLAAPSLLKAWGLQKSALGYVFALGFIGMGLGTLLSGWIGDRFGRRNAILSGVAVFGVATLASGIAGSITQIAIWKTIAGIGLGGIPGTAAAMIAEFTPKRWRSLAVTFGVVCVSLGGIVGGLVAAAILPHYGWRTLFYAGGGLTLAITGLMIVFLPESPAFLMTRPSRRAELATMLSRMGHPALDCGRTTEPHSQQEETVPLSALFSGRLLRDVLALSIAALTGMFMIYLMFNWAPTMLASADFAPATASLGLTAFNSGGTVGAILAALVILQRGSRGPLIVMAIIGAMICATLAMLPITGGRHALPLLAGLCGLGLFASAAQSAMFSVGAHAFPAPLRARGMGIMGAAGRIGALSSALLGASLIATGSPGFFGMLAILMLINAVGFLMVRAHIPRAARRATMAAVA